MAPGLTQTLFEAISGTPWEEEVKNPESKPGTVRERSHRGIRKNPRRPLSSLPDEALAHFACGCSNES